jgi:putative hydrolase of the HAD superfamily
MRARAVTFDFGQTLADLDTAFLSRRLAERGLSVAPEALQASEPLAWRAYNAGILAGEGGHPWATLMRELLRQAGAPHEPIADVVEWLWSEQPARNLWRRPVPGMIELVRRLDLPVGIISNSEGRVRALAEELGWGQDFAAVADSGALGVTKPDPRIFEWTAAQLGVAPAEIVHVGDSWPADVLGARGAGFSAIWFRGDAGVKDGGRIRAAADAAQVEAALGAFGVTAR